MLLLVSGATPTVQKYAASPNLGCLLTPRSRNSLESMAGLPWAADNDCFGGFDGAAEARFRAMLTKIAGTSPLFVTAPDVVADAVRTLAMFDTWEPIIREHGLPVALIQQDGQTSAARQSVVAVASDPAEHNALLVQALEKALPYVNRNSNRWNPDAAEKILKDALRTNKQTQI